MLGADQVMAKSMVGTPYYLSPEMCEVRKCPINNGLSVANFDCNEEGHPMILLLTLSCRIDHMVPKVMCGHLDVYYMSCAHSNMLLMVVHCQFL